MDCSVWPLSYKSGKSWKSQGKWKRAEIVRGLSGNLNRLSECKILTIPYYDLGFYQKDMSRSHGILTDVKKKSGKRSGKMEIEKVGTLLLKGVQMSVGLYLTYHPRNFVRQISGKPGLWWKGLIIENTH